MPVRRLRALGLLVVLTLVVAACGHGGTERASMSPTTSPSTTTTTTAGHGSAALAGSAVAAFGDQLFAAAAAKAGAGDDVIVSPLSVAVALALLEPGAVGPARDQLRTLLHIQDPTAFHASLAALEHDLVSRPSDRDGGELHLGVADAGYLQRGYPFRQSYLDALKSDGAPVLHQVDFATDPDAVAHQIDAFVAQATHGKIPKLVADGVLQRDTVLALVNALYLKASWFAPFDANQTEVHHRFTRLDGSTVDVPLMHGSAGGSATGDGWVGAEKAYVGGLELQVVLPDAGRLADVAGHLADVFAAVAANAGGEAELAFPRFTVRHHQELDDALRSLGLTAPYDPNHLTGIADDPNLVLSQVIHETYVTMDEHGTEAAAATAAIATATAAPVNPPKPVVVDRPFFFRIVDTRTGATLFEGRVLDPTA